MTSLLLSALLLIAGPARADEPKTADKTTIQLVEYFLKTPLEDANTKLVEPFLAVDPESLPKKLRMKAKGKQIEIRDLIKLHDTKKAGVLIQPKNDCSEKDFVSGLDELPFYRQLGYEEVNEDELEYVKNKTKCTEIDLGCRFSLHIFFKKGKDRRLFFVPSDPIMALVAESHGKGGSTKFFGLGLTCMH